MSGGEQARVLLARLLATRAPLMVADEPAAGLDPDAQLLTLELLRAEAACGAAVVVTLHDLTLAARSCDRIVVLNRGRVVADAAPRAILQGRHLIAVGLAPGPEFKALLAAAFEAQLDGAFGDEANALIWLRENFPKSPAAGA
jgi:iron complex transport system ATP-binding protein